MDVLSWLLKGSDYQLFWLLVPPTPVKKFEDSGLCLTEATVACKQESNVDESEVRGSVLGYTEARG